MSKPKSDVTTSDMAQRATRILAGRESAEYLMSDARSLAAAYLREHPADDSELADIDWLQERGAKWSTDGTALVLKGDAGPEIVCGVNRRSGEEYVGGIALCWTYRGSTDFTLSYLIDDEPTRRDVRRLAAALGITLREQP